MRNDRRSGFDNYSLEARRLANCVLCPRGFERKVCLMWLDMPVCQSCFIGKLEERNREINDNIRQGNNTNSNPEAIRAVEAPCRPCPGDSAGKDLGGVA